MGFLTNRQLVAVSWSMPPALFPRSIQVARLMKGLQGLGWGSTVITLDERSRGAAEPSDPQLSELYSGYYRTEPLMASALPEVPKRLWLSRALRTLPPLDAHWARDAAAAVRRVSRRENPEVLVTFAQPWRDHFVGLAMSRPRLPWVAHFSDPWVDSLYYEDMPDADRERDLQSEAAVIKQADLVIFTNQYAVDLVMQKYPAAWRSKARVVQHATDPDLLPLVQPSASSASPRRSSMRLSYVGSLLVGRRSAHDLLAALALLDTRIGIRGRIELVLIGSGSGTEEAKETVAALGLESVVSFQPHVMYLDSLRSMHDSDVLLLIDAPAATNVFLASKLADYLLADRPILAITPPAGPSADLLRSSGQSLADPGDIEGIARAIAELLERHEAGAPPRTVPDAVKRTFHLDTVARAFADVLDEAARGFSWKRRWL